MSLSQFDDFTSDPYNSTLNFVDCKLDGALCYNAFRVATPDPFLIQPVSLPNDIITGKGQQDVQGTPYFYANFSVSCFDLHNICYAVGIVIASAGIVAAQQSGTIQLTGSFADTSQPSVAYNLTSTRQIGEAPGKFDCADLPTTFACLKKVDVELVAAQTTTWPGFSGIRFDNLNYTAHF